MKILLVEDHEEVWDFLSRRLKRRGFEVAVAVDGQAGFDQAVPVAPDLILLDLNLPILDGWTVASLLRANERTSALPIIDLTAHAMSGDKEKALAAGCTDYHSKPVDFTRLLAQIDALTNATPK